MILLEVCTTLTKISNDVNDCNFFDSPPITINQHNIQWPPAPSRVSAHSLPGGDGGRRPSVRGKRSEGLAPGWSPIHPVHLYFPLHHLFLPEKERCCFICSFHRGPWEGAGCGWEGARIYRHRIRSRIKGKPPIKDDLII